MQCPACEEGILRKVQFISNKKKAYLCDTCHLYWWKDEHMDMTKGHMLGETDKFIYMLRKDNDEAEVQNGRARERYELSGRHQ